MGCFADHESVSIRLKTPLNTGILSEHQYLEDLQVSRPTPLQFGVHDTDLGELIIRLQPAPEVWNWIQTYILSEEGPIHNPDHVHLTDASVRVLWASSCFAKAGRIVLGQAEAVMFRAGGWQKARQEQQMIDWFGEVPSFLITLAADYCAQCTDAEFCALVEHELYHIAQATDQYGAPKFTQDGLPKLEMRGHDVEEFVGVVRRYGASPDVQLLFDAANKPAEVGKLNISRACGTCLLKSA
ncbi:putative metallopeptidase [Pseudomonas syringae pv. syringae]